MLVLSRKRGQTVVIGGEIRVTVISIHGDRVRLGIDAPRNLDVDRDEVHRRKTNDQGAKAPKTS